MSDGRDPRNRRLYSFQVGVVVVGSFDGAIACYLVLLCSDVVSLVPRSGPLIHFRLRRRRARRAWVATF